MGAIHFQLRVWLELQGRDLEASAMRGPESRRVAALSAELLSFPVELPVPELGVERRTGALNV